MHRFIIKLFVIAFGVFLLQACNSGGQQQAAESEQETASAEQTETTSAPEEETRPSPLKQVSGNVDGVSVSMQYSSPSVKEREIWGELVPYDQVWRTGANEATWVAFDKDVMIGGEKVPAGKYALFTIPTEQEWKVILNETWNQWGAYDYDASENIAEFEVPTEMQADAEERLKFSITDMGIRFEWEKLAFEIPVSAAG